MGFPDQQSRLHPPSPIISSRSSSLLEIEITCFSSPLQEIHESSAFPKSIAWRLEDWPISKFAYLIHWSLIHRTLIRTRPWKDPLLRRWITKKRVMAKRPKPVKRLQKALAICRLVWRMRKRGVIATRALKEMAMQRR